MANAAQDSNLLARAQTIWSRADRLAGAATHPFTRDQLALVALAARDAQAWIVEPADVVCPERARSVEASLDAQWKRLDELEDLLRVHGIPTDRTA